MDAILNLLLCLPILPQGMTPNAPDVQWETNHGTVVRKGKWLTIQNGSWTGTGEIRDDGTLLVLWRSSYHAFGFGHYRHEGDDYVGSWGYLEHVEFDENDNLIAHIEDKIVRRK